MSVIYRSFQDNIPRKARGYQILTFNLIKSSSKSEFHYKTTEYDFTLRRCSKFLNTYFMVKNDQKLIGILTQDAKLEVRSAKDSIKSAVKCSVAIGKSRANAFELSDRNYCIEYEGSIIEIKKGEKIWFDELGRIIIGCNGTYSPPYNVFANHNMKKFNRIKQ